MAAAKKAAAKTSAAPTASGSRSAALADWDDAELAAIREELQATIAQLRAQLASITEDIDELVADAASATGDDQADTGSRAFERDQEVQVAQNAQELLEQSERALSRLEQGNYGLCESCGQPIAKGRLQAYPSATLCVTCKAKQERR